MRGSPLSLTCSNCGEWQYVRRTGETKPGTARVGKTRTEHRRITLYGVVCTACRHRWWSHWNGADRLPLEPAP